MTTRGASVSAGEMPGSGDDKPGSASDQPRSTSNHCRAVREKDHLWECRWGAWKSELQIIVQ